MHRTEIEVRRNDPAVGLVCRILYGRKLIYIHLLGDNHDTARVLGSSSLDTDDVSGHISKMSLGKGFSPLLAYLAADSISILILISTDRTCLECMRAAEQHADIRMRSGLIFTGEVKIDIRLLVSLESEECLERYILTVRY